MTDEQKAVEQVATPRCDAEEYDAIANTNSALLANDKQYVVPADFARQLERELTAAKKRIADDSYECSVMSALTGRQEGETLTMAVERMCRIAVRESLVSAAPPEGMVEEIERLSEKATPGPWSANGHHIDAGETIHDLAYIVCKSRRTKENAAFIAALVNAWRSRMIAARPVAAPLREALAELHVRAHSFFAFLEGEHGVKLSSEEHEDHNVYKFFDAMDRARALLEDGK